MQKAVNIISTFNFGLFILAAMLWIFDAHISVPDFLTVAGRLHPILLHLPIGMFASYVVLFIFKRSFRSQEYDMVLDLMLLLSCFSALVTAVFGSVLSHEPEAYSASEIAVHRHAGFAFATGLYLFYQFRGRYPFLDRLIAGASVLLMILAGHKGAEITHGKDFIFPHAAVDGQPQDTGATVYAAVIVPIMEKKCYSCHNSEKTKGGLILIDTLSLLKGGESGPAFIAGNADSSLLIRNILLPADHKDHMPPEGKAQLTALEKDILTAWIKGGASFGQKLSSLGVNDPARKFFEARHVSKIEKKYDFSAVDEKELTALNTPQMSVRPIFNGSPALQASFFLAHEYSHDHLKKLSALRNNIVHLNMAGVPVKDGDLVKISQFSNLEKLILNGTDITDQGLLSLGALSRLEHLSLSNTAVSVAMEPLLEKLRSLKHVYLDGTGVPETAITQWQKKYPAITFYFRVTDRESVKLTPPLLVNETTVLKTDEEVKLKHYINGVKILYTVDGSMPDSVHGTEYKKPVPFTGSADIRAIAVRDGWIASDVVTYSLFERGTPPDSCTLLTKPNIQYPGTGPTTFTNAHRGAISNLKDQNWIAFRENPFAAIFEYKKPQAVSRISFCYGLQVPAYVFPPVSVNVSGSNDRKDFKLLASQQIPAFDKDNKDQVKPDVLHLTLKGTPYKYYKIEARNLALIPKWHPGKGEKGWLFIDEIFFY